MAFTVEGERLNGDAAKSQLNTNPKNTVFDAKQTVSSKIVISRNFLCTTETEISVKLAKYFGRIFWSTCRNTEAAKNDVLVIAFLTVVSKQNSTFGSFWDLEMG